MGLLNGLDGLVVDKLDEERQGPVDRDGPSVAASVDIVVAFVNLERNIGLEQEGVARRVLVKAEAREVPRKITPCCGCAR